MGTRRNRAPDPDAAFKADLVAAGGELLAPTNPYEVMRFRTSYGVGVVYTNAKGRRTENAEAISARQHLRDHLGSLSPVPVVPRQKNRAVILRLRGRDGSMCFFCRTPLGDDITVEHLVPRAHGGPNHISNPFLAHESCNRRVGHLSAPEKIAMRDAWVCEPIPFPTPPDHLSEKGE
jgi:5-methylcytosine-specific restriction endonuclease McrA